MCDLSYLFLAFHDYIELLPLIMYINITIVVITTNSSVMSIVLTHWNWELISSGIVIDRHIMDFLSLSVFYWEVSRSLKFFLLYGDLPLFWGFSVFLKLTATLRFVFAKGVAHSSDTCSLP